VLALLVAIGILVACYALGAEPAQLVPRAITLFVVLLFIWYADAVGTARGFVGGRPGYIDKDSPGCMVAALGWIALAVYGFLMIRELLHRKG
jgi:hypothetical protein